jgi:SAM-dependent methyltransferase
MRRSIHLLIKSLAEKFEFDGPIYEFGSLQTPGQENRARLRKFFPNKEYVGCDLRMGPGVDRILDLHNIELPSESAGTVILLDVLEHVEFCKRAMEEIHRVLRPGGMVIIASVMYFPIHNYPSDYWRFTPNGFRSLLAPFTVSIVESAGLERFPSTVLAIAFKGDVPNQRVKAFHDEVLSWKKGMGNSWQEWITAFLPPILFVYLYPLYRKIESGGKKSSNK